MRTDVRVELCVVEAVYELEQAVGELEEDYNST